MGNWGDGREKGGRGILMEAIPKSRTNYILFKALKVTIYLGPEVTLDFFKKHFPLTPACQ